MRFASGVAVLRDCAALTLPSVPRDRPRSIGCHRLMSCQWGSSEEERDLACVNLLARPGEEPASGHTASLCHATGLAAAVWPSAGHTAVAHHSPDSIYFISIHWVAPMGIVGPRDSRGRHPNPPVPPNPVHRPPSPTNQVIHHPNLERWHRADAGKRKTSCSTLSPERVSTERYTPSSQAVSFTIARFASIMRPHRRCWPRFSSSGSPVAFCSQRHRSLCCDMEGKL